MNISASTRLSCVLGDPVLHSRSPVMHNAAFVAAGIDAVYLACRVESANLCNAVRSLAALGALGASVTVPHKEAVLAACDDVTPRAQRIGAVNTLRFEGQRVYGDNTDAPGFVRAFEEDRSLLGQRVLVLGSGGAARAVSVGCLEAGASVSVVARRPESVAFAPARPWEEAVLKDAMSQCDVLVDATSMGLSEQGEDAVPFAPPVDALHDNAVVGTLVYHRETRLVLAARRRGLSTFDGAGMLIHQGAIAFEAWTGVAPNLQVMRDAFFAPVDL